MAISRKFTADEILGGIQKPYDELKEYETWKGKEGLK